MPRSTTLQEETRRLLRCLTVGDASVLTTVMGGDVASPLDPRTDALIEVAALVAIEAEPASYSAAVERARAAGVEDEEIVGALATVASLVGAARVHAALPGLATALGFDPAVLDQGAG